MASTAPTTPDGRSSSRLTDDARSDGPPPQPPIRNICCVGAGYVGGPTAATIAYWNPHIRVTVVDRDERRIKRWNSKHLPIYEPGLRDILGVARDGARSFSFLSEPSIFDKDTLDMSSSRERCPQRSRLSGSRIDVPARQPNLVFSVDMAKSLGEADLVLLAVNTPTKLRGVGAGRATDMTATEAAIKDVANYARSGTIIVEKSTVPCGTSQLIQDTISACRPGDHFEVLSNPEFLAAGMAVEGLMKPDRVLIGSSQTRSGRRAAAALADVYAGWVPRERILMTNVWSSELTKLVSNAMLAQRISSINSISAICEKTGADIEEVSTSVGLDSRIGTRFLQAGIGFGGSCFKKDILSLVYLAQSLDLEEVGEYWLQVIKMNDYQRDRFSRRVIRCLNNSLVGKKITFLGYAFKAETSDMRGSLALEIIDKLLEEDPEEIAIFDPSCNPAAIGEELERLLTTTDALKENGGALAVYSDPYEACAGSNAVLITTDCAGFGNRPPLQSSAAGAGGKGHLDPLLHVQSRVTAIETEVFALRTWTELEYDMNAIKGAQEYQSEPTCPEDCPECRLLESNRLSNRDGPVQPHAGKDYVDWHRISNNMKDPKWLFDGRGIIDPREMKRLGIRVESIGNRSGSRD
ncbi:nucleotide sugar dehydrogenase [Poronia punctata]|nr:nucleotide sugar dehydrogenase [Poronia punctata]